MFPRAAIFGASILAALTFASSAFAITATPSSQSYQYGSQKATVAIGDVGGATEVLVHLVRANGVIVNTWQTGPGNYTWGGKAIGTDTVTVCPDTGHDGTCDEAGATASVTWTQFPAIYSYKNATSNVDRAIFSNGADVQFQMNVVCNPTGTFFQRQGFFLMSWSDSLGSHRFTMDYLSTMSCMPNGQGGYDQTVFGWGRIGADAYPFKIILRTSFDPAHPVDVRFGIGNAPPGADWDFLNGTLTKGTLNFTPGT